jgi:UDP-N-acetyl-2-amino-2-deoxyglucuronate dehydrogenase
MAEEKIGFGIVGCGVIGPTHAEAIAAVEMAKLVACCDIVPEKARALSERFGGVPWYTDYEEMLEKQEDLQAVCVCTPSGLHAPVAIAAAQAGKHILCEKPLDITLRAIDEMIAAADKYGVKLAGVFQNRTLASSRRVREAVRTGKLGKLVLGDCYQKYFRSHEYYASGEWRGTWELDGGGALMNQGVHGLDLLLWIMGNAKRVNAQCRTLARNISVEDTAVAIVEFENRALGTIEGTTSVTPGYGMRLEISGTQGTIKWENGKIVAWDVAGEEGAEVEAESGGRGTAAHPTAGLTATGHAHHVLDLCLAIRENREPEISGREARRAVELIKAIYLSSRLGGDTVELPLSYEDDGPGIYPPLGRLDV